MTIIRYRHTQVGYVLIAALGGALVFISLLMASIGFSWVGLGVGACLALCIGLLPTLTVEILDKSLLVYYGLGYIWKKIPLRQIGSCRVIRVPWFWGWGLKWTPRGWMYRVSGLHAVLVETKSGRNYLLGSDEPEKLAEAIETVCSM